MWVRVHFVVEGQTEEQFVNTVLRKYFEDRSIQVTARVITTGRDRHRHHLTHKGGLNKFGHAYREIHRCIMEDKTALCTTMFDLYQIPEDFPGYQQSSKIIDPYERVDTLEKWLAEKIDNRRFIPYIQLYEFETLLFSDIQKLQMQHPDFIDQINKLAETTSTL